MKEVIAISGQPGAGSTTTGKILAEKLSLKYFSPGQLFKDIAKGKLKEQFYYNNFKRLCAEKNLVIPEMSEKDDSTAASKLWQTDLGKSRELHNIIDELQNILSEEGGIVFDGKLSLHMIKNSDIKIWLKASLDKRSERLVKRDNLSLDEIKKLTELRQNTEREEWKKIYGFDYWAQEEKADLVVDTSNTESEKVVEEILKRLNGKL